MNKFVFAALLGAALLAGGCGTAKLYEGNKSVAQLAVIRGDLKIPAVDGGQVLLLSVDGRSIGANNNRATVEAGEHTITLSCRIPAEQISNTSQVTFTAYAARIYELDMARSGDACNGYVTDLATGQRVGG